MALVHPEYPISPKLCLLYHLLHRLLLQVKFHQHPTVVQDGMQNIFDQLTSSCCQTPGNTQTLEPSGEALLQTAVPR